MKHSLPVFLFLLFLAVSAQAAPLPGMQDKQPVDVTADNMEYSADKNTVVFKGRVEAVRGEFKMWSEKLTLFLKAEEGKSVRSAVGMDAVQNSDLDRIVAEQNVRFQNGTQKGTASKATYIADKGILVMEGNPILYDGDNSIRGSVIRYFVNENRSVVESSAKQRVHAVFSSGEKGK